MPMARNANTTARRRSGGRAVVRLGANRRPRMQVETRGTTRTHSRRPTRHNVDLQPPPTAEPTRSPIGTLRGLGIPPDEGRGRPSGAVVERGFESALRVAVVVAVGLGRERYRRSVRDHDDRRRLTPRTATAGDVSAVPAMTPNMIPMEASARRERRIIVPRSVARLGHDAVAVADRRSDGVLCRVQGLEHHDELAHERVDVRGILARLGDGGRRLRERLSSSARGLRGDERACRARRASPTGPAARRRRAPHSPSSR